MQTNKIKYTSFIILTSVFSFAAALARLVSMIFSFDFNSFFYSNDIVPYSIYIIYIIFGASAYLIGKNLVKETGSNFKNDILHEIFFALLTIVFILFAIIGFIGSYSYFTNIYESKNLIKTITNVVCPIFSVLSAIYFSLRLFLQNPKRHAVSLLAMSPVIFLAVFLVERFSTISASASSLSHFPNIISLLFLSVYMLNEGKALIPTVNNAGVSASIASLTVISLSFSAVPDLIFALTKASLLSVEEIFFLIFKLIYIVLIFTDVQVKQQKNN